MTDKAVRRGAGIYSRPVLSFYDLLVTYASNSLAWRCPRQVMLEQYDRLIGRRHLDVGPGTGWYLGNVELPAHSEITLMDLNRNSLDSAAARIGGVAPRRVVGNILDPLPADTGKFDSIGMNYLLHCIPGAWPAKGRAFGHVASHLNPDGSLFGATILGGGVSHNLGGRGLMAFYNKLGIFHNREDDAEGLRVALAQSFVDVNVDVVGVVAVFSARSPRP